MWTMYIVPKFLVYYTAKGAITVYCIRADGKVSVISRLINYTQELNVFALAGSGALGTTL